MPEVVVEKFIYFFCALFFIIQFNFTFFDFSNYDFDFLRALYEMLTESDPIEWLDGTRMKEDYKGSPAFWRELSMDKMEEDKFVQYGEYAFLPQYMKRAHRSRLS